MYFTITVFYLHCQIGQALFLFRFAAEKAETIAALRIEEYMIWSRSWFLILESAGKSEGMRS